MKTSSIAVQYENTVVFSILANAHIHTVKRETREIRKEKANFVLGRYTSDLGGNCSGKDTRRASQDGSERKC